MIGNAKPVRRFAPFPAYADRAGWDGIPQSKRQFLISAAKGLKGKEWASLPAIRYMDFFRDGNRSRFQALYFNRRTDLFALLLAECLEGKGEYIEDIINGVWLICEETSWVVPAHNNHRHHDEPVQIELPNIEEPVYIDLFAAETAALLSWVYYFLGEEIARLSPLVKRRIELEMERRILTPYLHNDTFRWMGLSHSNPVNNWNPWINSNVLVVFLVFGETFPEMLEPGIVKTIRSIERFLHFYAEDGGCDEGPGYFGKAGASLFDFLEELEHIADISDIYAQPLIRNMASYIYRVYIGGKYFVNYADSSPTPGMDADLLSRMGKKIQDANLVGFAAHLGAIGKKGRDTGDIPRNTLFRYLSSMFGKPGSGVFFPPKSFWFEGIQVVAARDAQGSMEGMFFSAKGGCNAESHNHNDIGNFLVYWGDTPVIVDAGVEEYTKFTFSDRRYALWTMQSCYHNTPTINGTDQLPGREYRAGDVTYESDGDTTRLKLDIAGAYPAGAGVAFYRREFAFVHGKSLTLTDTYSVTDYTVPLILNLLCYDKPVISGDEALLSDAIILSFDSGQYNAIIEEISLTDTKIRRDWSKDALYRLRLVAKEARSSGDVSLRFTRK